MALKNLRILIVDDSAIEREVLARAISQWGFQARTAANGIEALAALEAAEVDLLLLDLYMPVLNGLEIIDQVRKHESFKDLPIIVLSGANPPQDLACYRAGADHYLVKPFRPARLQRILQDQLEPS